MHQSARKWEDVPLILTVSELAEFMGVSKSCIYSLVAAGLPAKQAKEGGRLLFSRDKVREWIES